MARTDAQREIALLRLVARGVADSRHDSSERAVQWLLCLQAQDYWSGVSSVALPSGTSIAAVESVYGSPRPALGRPRRATELG
jgi:hypothetical protein